MNVSSDYQTAGRRYLYIQLLGNFRVSCGTFEVAEFSWRLRNAERLLKLLALAPDYRLHREEIFDALWPHLDPDAAANNLRYTSHVARRVLGTVTHDEVLLRHGDQILLAPGEIKVDVTEFDAYAWRAQDAGNIDDYEQALGLYTGDLLPEDRYEDWSAWRRESLRTTYFALLFDLATLYENSGNLSAASACLQRTIDYDSAHEDAHVGLMRLYIRRGQRHRALRQYQQLQTTLREELGVDPDPATQRLYQDILTDQIDTPSLRDVREESDDSSLSTTPTRHNLPFQLTSFIGRKREIESIRTLLKDNRLVTLTGSGGSGKTRLAIEIARALIVDFPAGVWMIDLATITAPEHVLSKVSATLGVVDQPNRALTDVLMDSLVSRRLLLILDNCEHVLTTCNELVSRLLHSCPEVHMLATSRERLHIAGEQTFLVYPLEAPEQNGPTAAESIARVESVQLFSERAALVQANFRITSENARAVARICEQLDGIPLAIELAAARLSVLTPDELASRLDDAFAVLTDGNWSSMPRHRTLRSTLDWSYSLLSEEEQRLLGRLSVFSNGCTLDACHAVCGETDQDSNDTLSYLAQLVDKSLVVVDIDANRTRYRLLTVVQQYATEQLNESGEADKVRLRHARYFLETAKSIEPQLLSSEEKAGTQTLEVELDNLRSALSCLQADEPESALHLAGSLGRFWWARGYYKEGTDWLASLLSRDRTVGRSHMRTNALAWAFLLTFRQGNHDDAREFVHEQLELATELNDTAGTAWSLLYLSMLVGEGGDYNGEVELLNESLALFRQVNDRTGIARVLNSLGEAARYDGDYDGAVQLYKECLELWRDLGDSPYIGLALHNLGRTVLRGGDARRARQHLAEGLSHFHALGTRNGIALCLSGLAGVATESDEPETAARLLGAADALRRELGVVEEALDHEQSQAAIDAARLGLGEEDFASAWDAGSALKLDEAVAEAMAVGSDRWNTALIFKPSAVQLSERERDVSALIAKGFTNTQISSELGISKRTADTHVSRILRKLGISSRLEITE